MPFSNQSVALREFIWIVYIVFHWLVSQVSPEWLTHIIPSSKASGSYMLEWHGRLITSPSFSTPQHGLVGDLHISSYIGVHLGGVYNGGMAVMSTPD